MNIIHLLEFSGAGHKFTAGCLSGMCRWKCRCL